MRFNKSFVVGLVLVALALIGAATVVQKALTLSDWKHITDVRGYQAEEAYKFLTTPIAVDKNGKQLSREDFIDALIQQAVKSK